MSEDPDYGPRGYLPERAARRARKIVLREPLGVGWVLAAVLAGLVLLVTGIVFLARGEPVFGPPFVPAGRLDAVGEIGAGKVFAGTGEPLLLVRVGQAVRVYEHPGVDVTYCRDTTRLESAAGHVWNLNGRLLTGSGESLQPLRFAVHDGRLFVNLSELPEKVAPDPEPRIAASCA